jgi:hypothetical protein
MVLVRRVHSLGMRNEGHDQPGMIKLYALSEQSKTFGAFFYQIFGGKTEVHMGLGLGTW